MSLNSVARFFTTFSSSSSPVSLSSQRFKANPPSSHPIINPLLTRAKNAWGLERASCRSNSGEYGKLILQNPISICSCSYASLPFRNGNKDHEPDCLSVCPRTSDAELPFISLAISMPAVKSSPSSCLIIITDSTLSRLQSSLLSGSHISSFDFLHIFFLLF
eukprot:jgi/Picsp_1/5813/NSC_03172-R1_---NA---